MKVKQYELKPVYRELRCDCDGCIRLKEQKEITEFWKDFFCKSKWKYIYECDHCGKTFEYDRPIKLREMYFEDENGIKYLQFNHPFAIDS